ncbi:hypothetical protein CDL12_00154 [Handroanthus impetiginosus]|uniref:Wall-associated receptor kinase galacturonan-binding domain-containing protein n=1 Tax=Handroanthus impetiginosus TaxID=429701 RepID=A0A2G9IBG2_9LAMI|nr:hypothetical protein CDL12_00154 [Handroanthus impetiginosus]
MLSQNLVLKCFYYLFMIMICFLQTCHGKQSPYNCSPSACGHIHNISSPFGLRDDPQHCGNPIYNLSCENNTTTILYLGSQNYHVQAINYENQTIRLTDPTIKKNDTCSFPQHSLSIHDFGDQAFSAFSFPQHSRPYMMAMPIAFMSCPYPVSDSALTLDITQDCFNQSGNNTRHTYIKFFNIGEPNIIDTMCRIDLMTMTSLRFKDAKNVSLKEFHSFLLYGFELRFRARKFMIMSCRIHCQCWLPVYIMRSSYWRPVNIMTIMTAFGFCWCDFSGECEYFCTTSSFCYYKYGNLTYGSF